MCKNLIHMLVVAMMLAGTAGAQDAALVDAGAPFGMLKLVDEVDCGAVDEAHPVIESAEGVSVVEDILGRSCRVLKTDGDPKYFAFVVGKGKDLQAGKAYLLTVEFPEDKPRSMFILNRGCETPRGVFTGASLGDTIFNYTNNNLESLQIPLSGEYRTWKQLFFLHDRYTGIGMHRNADPRTVTPDKGFHVIIAQPSGANLPISAGAAVARIRLFEVDDVQKHHAAVNFPPAGLPRRHLFFREEMSDSLIGSAKVEQRGVEQDVDWYRYKAEVQKVLGLNTYCKDLLEFGHNQGWDSDDDDPWYNQARQPRRWQRMLKMLGGYDFTILPYYEYAGGPGPGGMGTKKLARPLTKEGPYTHITWSERFYADVTDPDTIAEAKKLLDYTIVRHKEKVNFLGAWFRVRPSHIPMSFHDNALERFAEQANDGQAVTREQLQADKALYEKYRQWWFGKRREFFVALRDHLRDNGIEDALVLFTADASEPGPSLPGKQIVTDDVAGLKQRLTDERYANIAVTDIDEVVAKDLYLDVVSAQRGTWGEWEWQHSLPEADPQNYKTTEGVLFTLPFNRAYTVDSPKPFDLYRGPSGLAIVRHYSLNENVMNVGKDAIVGYFVCDMERPGPYCMLGEARAMANGDPRYIGYLTGANFNRGFPEYVRDFNTAFLALPALPSERLDGAASSEQVVVRKIDAKEHGTYLAVINTGLTDAANVTISLPVEGEVTNAATGEAIEAADGKVTVSLYPCQMMALRVVK